jgi:hypothetical protein
VEEDEEDEAKDDEISDGNEVHENKDDEDESSSEVEVILSPARKKQKKAPSLDQDDNKAEAEGYKEEKSFSSPTRKKRKKAPLLDPCAAERDTNVTGGFTGTSITTKEKKVFAAKKKGNEHLACHWQKERK